MNVSGYLLLIRVRALTEYVYPFRHFFIFFLSRNRLLWHFHYISIIENPIISIKVLIFLTLYKPIFLSIGCLSVYLPTYEIIDLWNSLSIRLSCVVDFYKALVKYWDRLSSHPSIFFSLFLSFLYGSISFYVK